MVDPTATSTVLAAVADGVGGARLAHVASALAVRHAVELLSASLLAEPDSQGRLGPPDWPQLADQLAAKVADLLSEERVVAHSSHLGMASIGEHTRNRREMPATTLAVLAVDDTAAGIQVSWFTVGDCEVAVADITARKVTWLTPVADRDGQRTEAVPSTQKASYSGRYLIGDGQAVLAVTDGMAELLHDKPEYTLRALATARKQGNALGDLLVALDLRLQAAHDDRSMVAIGPISRDER